MTVIVPKRPFKFCSNILTTNNILNLKYFYLERSRILKMNMISNTSDFGMLSPIKCSHLNILSAWCSVILVFSVICNLFLLMVIGIRKNLRGYRNIFMTTFVIFNFLGSLMELPIMIISNFYCR